MQTGFDVKNLSFSPITGGEGNIEFLLHLFWAGEEREGINLLTGSPATNRNNCSSRIENENMMQMIRIYSLIVKRMTFI